MKRAMVLLLCTGVVFLAGCGEGQGRSYVIEASDFDQSCSTHDGCMLVNTGDFCGCTACSDAAISTDDRDAYFAEVERAIDACEGEERGCPSLTEERASQALSCRYVRAVCDAGTCSTQPFSEISGDVVDVIDRSCQTDSDCTTVPEDFDEPCGCRVAISTDDDWRAEQIASSQGGFEDVSCDCASDLQPARCVAGTCKLDNGGACEVIGWRASACQ